MSKNFGILFLFIHLIFGFYIINIAFNFILMPLFIQSIDKGIILVAGLLLILEGIIYLKPNKGSLFY